MPHDFTRRDDAGRPITDEQYERLVERDELRLERYTAPENPDLVAFRVIDAHGKVRGFIGFEWDAMEKELPVRMLQRVQRSITPRPDLRLVG